LTKFRRLTEMLITCRTEACIVVMAYRFPAACSMALMMRE
jgi:hypothetical protein